MRFFDGAAVDAALGYPGLVDILEAAFVKGAIAPPRHHHGIALDGRPEATLLLMPAWEAQPAGSAFAGRFMGVKTVTIFPDNDARANRPCLRPTFFCRPRRGRCWPSWMLPASPLGVRRRHRRWRAAACPGRTARGC